MDCITIVGLPYRMKAESPRNELKTTETTIDRRFTETYSLFFFVTLNPDSYSTWALAPFFHTRLAELTQSLQCL